MAASAQASNPALRCTRTWTSGTSSSSSYSAEDSFAAPPLPPPLQPLRPLLLKPAKAGPSRVSGWASRSASRIGFDVATPIVRPPQPARRSHLLLLQPQRDNIDNLVVNGTLKLQNSGVMVDWFPFRGHSAQRRRDRLQQQSVTATLNEPSGSSFTLGNDKYYADVP